MPCMDRAAQRDEATEAALRAAVAAAAKGYFAERRARIDPFVDRWYSARGALRLHRHALGWDIARAPANVGLAPVQMLARLGAGAAEKAGRKRSAAWLRSRRLMFDTAVMKEVRRLVLAELLELPTEGHPGDALAEAIVADPEVRRLVGRAAPGLGAALADYAGTRSAVAEMTAALATMGAGAAALHQITPGAMTLGPALAAAMAQSAAISAFPLGAAAGSVWYGIWPAAASPALVAGTTAGLMTGAALIAAFAGVVADPAQRALGLHQRRLRRLVDAMEKEFVEGEGGGFAAREHYVARLFDVMDAGAAALRAFRG